MVKCQLEVMKIDLSHDWPPGLTCMMWIDHWFPILFDQWPHFYITNFYPRHFFLG